MLATKEDRKLLYVYLKKEYKKHGCNSNDAKYKAKELIKNNSDNLFGYHGLAWSLGKRSIEFFCKYFLQDTFTPKPNNQARELAQVHYELWEALENMFIFDKYDKFAAAINRGCAKTTVLDFALSMWAHCYEVSIYTLIAGATEQDSVEFVSQAKQNFEENEYIIQAFGNLIDDKNFTVNKLELELSNHTKIQAISSTSSPRGKKYNGFRPTIIIADDYQTRKDILTEDARSKKYRTWMEDCKYAGDKAVYRDGKKIKMATKFLVIGTILHQDCFMSRILNNKEYKTMFRRVVDFDVDEYFEEGLWLEFKRIYFDNKLDDPEAHAIEFYYQHEEDMKFNTIWDDKYICYELAMDYYSDPIGFKQEMMNDASKIGQRNFKSIITESAKTIETHNFAKTMLCLDPAGTDNKNKKKEDFYAFCVGSLAYNGFKYVRKGEILKIEYDTYVKHTLELLLKYEDITHVYIEKNTYMGADLLKIKEEIDKIPELKYRRIEFINEMQKSNKDDKILTIVGEVNNGQILFNEDDSEFTQQILDFAGQDFSYHDDAPDITAEFANRINNIFVTTKVNVLDRSKFGL